MKVSLPDRITCGILLLALMVPMTMLGQLRFSEQNADCTGAIALSDSIYGPTATIRGFGNVLEIQGNEKENPKTFEREHNSLWFKITAPWNGDLTFDIIPVDPDDDIDFMLFKSDSTDLCTAILNGNAVPIRSNISRSDPEMGSRTGLDLNAFEPYVASGVGNAYSMSVPTQEKDLFYLVIDYPQRPINGFSIALNFGPQPLEEPIPVTILKRQQVVHIRVFDETSKKPIDAAIAIEGMIYDSIVSGEGMSDYTFAMEHYKTLRLNCAKKGYMLHTEKVRASGEPVVKVDLHLRAIAPGQKVILDDIRFVGNRDKVLGSSESSLQQLLDFMTSNPDVSIEIQGHVNGPKLKNRSEFVQLSADRARAVHDYLVSHEVRSNRLKFKGYGNSKMLYPEARTREESEANRRVEIEVLNK